MLDSVRQNSRSAVIYILFGVLIAAFIVSFGPGSPTGDSVFDGLGGRYAARVHGSEISEQELSFSFIALGLPSRGEAQAQRLREVVMDRLIERELLAHEAEESGLLVSEDEAAKLLVDGNMFVAGIARKVEPYAMRGGSLDYERLRMVVQNSYRLTMKQFVEIQRRELLADKFRQLLRTGTRASLDEVRTEFEDKSRQTNLEYVRFAPFRYEQEVVASDDDIEAWAKAHEAEVKKTYEERKLLYVKQDKSAKLRRILLDVKKDASEAQVSEAKAKLAVALASVQGGKSFAEVAMALSEDEATKRRGGSIGWRKKGTTDFGTELEAKIFAAKEGDLIGPERSERGLELIKVEGFREGDIPIEKARAELAEELYRSAKGKELAQAGAMEAATKLKAGGKLAELFPKDDSDAAEAQAKGSKIQVEETGMFARKGDTIPGIGSSAELVKKAFAVKPGEVVGPIDVSGAFLVAMLKERKEPDLVDFDKKKDELAAEYGRTKWARLMTEYARHACVAANADGKLKVNQTLIADEPPARRGAAPALAVSTSPTLLVRPAKIASSPFPATNNDHGSVSASPRQLVLGGLLAGSLAELATGGAAAERLAGGGTVSFAEDAACVGVPLEGVGVFFGVAAKAGVYVGTRDRDLDLAGRSDVERAGAVTDLAADVTEIGSDAEGWRCCLLPFEEGEQVAARRGVKGSRVAADAVVGQLFADLDERAKGAAVLGGLPQLVRRLVEVTGAEAVGGAHVARTAGQGVGRRSSKCGQVGLADFLIELIDALADHGITRQAARHWNQLCRQISVARLRRF
jgi:peptidyl-prolyl cis-trans isomerase D